MRFPARRLTTRGEAQQRRMVDAAYEIIAARGFEGLRTREVAARAGLNISTFHYYFPSKEDLVRSVAQRLLLEFKAASSHGTSGDGARDELHREFLDQAHAIGTKPATYVVLMELFVRSLRDGKLRPIFAALLDAWESRIHAYVSKGIREGEIPSASNPEASSRALQCLLLGSAINLLAKRKSTSLEAVHRQVSQWLMPHRWTPPRQPPKTRSAPRGQTTQSPSTAG
jgi:AcrR family transcriptional regulator